jgi:hypothetical protein
VTGLDVIAVRELTQTCDCSPAQWQGRLLDGRWIYVRYRWGHLQIGTGASLDDAVDDAIATRGERHGDEYDGHISYQDLRRLAPHIDWPL